MDYKFYNPEKKKEYLEKELGYISEIDKQNKIIIFAQVGAIEKMLNKDVSDFNLQELINLFEYYDWTYPNTFQTKKSIITKYIEWVKKQDAKALPIGMIKNEDLTGEAGFRKKSFKDLEDLKKCLNYVYDNADVYDNSRFDMCKAVWYLAWYGFTQEETANLKKDDVDITKKIIKSSISDYVVNNVDDDIIHLLETIKNADGFYILVGKHQTIRNMRYHNNEYLIRATVFEKNRELEDQPINIKNMLSNASRDWKKINKKMSPLEDYYGKIVNYKVVFDSGVYSRLYNLEQQGIDLTKNDYEIINPIARIKNEKVKFTTYNGTEVEYNIQGRFIYQKYKKWKQFYYSV